MAFSKKFLTTNMIIFLLAVCLPISIVYAQDGSDALSQQQIDRIKDNCLSAKSSLSKLRVSDALLRVNMGQIYESISTKLMSGFNGRVSNNSMDNSALTGVADDYRTTLDEFRSDYKSYEEQLSSTINIDCSTQPESFYHSVVNARLKRQQVYTDIIKLNQYLDDYTSELTKFQTNLLSTKTTSGVKS